MDTRPHWLMRTVLGLLLAWHGYAVVGSLARERDWGRDIRAHTRTYEKVMGIHQNWSMFAPNAPRSSLWMEVEGVAVWDENIPIKAPLGQLLPGPIEWHYRRLGKLERLALKKSHSDIRRALTKTWCKRLDAERQTIKAVRFHQHWVRTPSPSQARKGKTPEHQQKLRQELKCRW